MSCPLCPKGSLPASYGESEHYKVKGSEEDLAPGVSCYISGDPKWGSAVIVCHDVFGPNKGKHHQFADAIANGGHYVVMPDFFQGGSIEPYYASNTVPQGLEWLKQFNWKHCSGILEKVHEHLREKGIERIGSVGFCWGAWVVAKLCQKKEFCQSGVWAHPSCCVAKELYEGETEQELADAVRAPTLILPSKQEPEFYKNGELVGIMEKNSIAAEAIHFSDMRHGWVTRGAGWLGEYYQSDTTEVNAIIGVQRAVNLTLGFYAKHLW